VKRGRRCAFRPRTWAIAPVSTFVARRVGFWASSWAVIAPSCTSFSSPDNEHVASRMSGLVHVTESDSPTAGLSVC